jgi:SH3-like domain-containing protein
MAGGVASGAAADTAATLRPPEAAIAPPESPPTRQTGPVTGLPLPRFAALRSDQVNLRAGPGTRYPIEWTFQRRDWPVEILREHDVWRRIRDADGTEGWVHVSTLTARRNFLVRGGEERLLRRGPDAEAAPVARLRPGVVGRLRRCEADSAWCEGQVGNHRGWIRRAEIWGVWPGEEVR